MSVSISHFTWTEDFDQQLQSFGLHLHYGEQETAVQFLEVSDVSNLAPVVAVQTKLHQLIEALSELEQSPQQISAALREPS